MSTYAEILGELKNLPLNNQNAKILKDALTNFGEGCQKFYGYQIYIMNLKMQ